MIIRFYYLDTFSQVRARMAKRTKQIILLDMLESTTKNGSATNCVFPISNEIQAPDSQSESEDLYNGT